MGSVRSVLLAGVAMSAALGGAEAATVNISGVPYTGFPGYGIAQPLNNVVNAPGSPPTASGLIDTTNTPGFSPFWHVTGPGNPAVATATVPAYTVRWFFNGAESGFANTFTSGGVTFTEGDQNNNQPGSPQIGPQFLGTTNGSTPVIPFTVDGVSNGPGNPAPGTGIASLMLSWVLPTCAGGALDCAFPTSWTLTTTPTDWFAFGLDDGGSRVDDNHDDYMGVAQVTAVPLPAALPLMATVLGGGYLVGRWRKRRKGLPSPAVA